MVQVVKAGKPGGLSCPPGIQCFKDKKINSQELSSGVNMHAWHTSSYTLNKQMR